MSSAFLEIIELPNGDFALQKADEDGDALVTITFSKDAKEFLKEHNVTVAKSMINAGIQTVGVISKQIAESDIEEEFRTVH
ncbi:hypothetical protein [Alkalimarinus alittae]|uniref:Uncharacterized protein n=1 Tax=Alkalimarinus alittae TaxID=2961619 RepID=A0ABY6MYB8_9ALTE|nr:hypothetical protein [Alkalimarinus alittae]UZE94833.1 hypothetical protein NKI27_12170 [Alkalimarinus alittae]